MSKHRRHELGVGILVLVALALLATMALQVGALRGVGDHVTARVVLPDAAGLTDGALVKIAGVDIGRVDSLGVEGSQAVLRLELRRDALVREDAVVAIRARSVLGEKFIEILPQSTDATLAQDDTVLTAAATPVEIDQLVNRLGPIIDALDPAQLSRSMEILNDALARDPQRVDRMLTDLETALHGLAQASSTLPGLMVDSQHALSAVTRAAADSRPVIARADRVMSQLEDGSKDLATTRASVDDLLHDSRKLVQQGDSLIERVDGDMAQVEAVLTNLSEIDKWELRRLLREEGILVRLRRSKVEEVPQELDELSPDDVLRPTP